MQFNVGYSFMESFLSSLITLCAQEPIPCRATLLRSCKIKAAQQRRPTYVATRFKDNPNDTRAPKSRIANDNWEE